MNNMPLPPELGDKTNNNATINDDTTEMLERAKETESSLAYD